ncbi:MAG: ABC transporter permease [Candidatus Bipolaricaulota bacterium]
MTNLLHNKKVVTGGVIILIFTLFAVLAPYITRYEIWAQDYTAVFAPISPDHFFGTDNFGRDIFTRVIYGSRASLLSALGAAGLAGVIGITLGLLGGYFGGTVDRITQGLTDAFWAFPSLLMALVLIVMLQPGLFTTMIAIALGYWPRYTQVLRDEVLSVREQEYIAAARSIGSGDVRILRSHILPNVIGPVIVLITITMGNAIIVEATLSFLGLGVQPPTPSWGVMLSNAREFMTRAPWFSVFPGVAIALTVLGFNLLGDGLRDVLDPHLTRQQ